MLKRLLSRMTTTLIIVCTLVLSVNFALATTSVEPTSNTSVVNSITLASVEGPYIKWTVDGYSKLGFKIVWSRNENPVYPSRVDIDNYHYLSDPSVRADKLDPFKGDGYYYVRVCEYLGGACGVYSNQIKIQLINPTEDAVVAPVASVKSITLLAGDGKVKWNIDGYSKNGFKVVWSKNENPTYPTRDGDKYNYLSDPGSYYSVLDAFSGTGTYFARVCEYLGGSCGVYSNQVSLTLNAKEPVACTMDYNPVCGKDGKTYSNKCQAVEAAGVAVAYLGECKKDSEITKIEDTSKLLVSNGLEAILAELRQLRDLVKEQQTEIRYLKSLFGDMKNLASNMQSSIKSFITYGVDDNTKKLGEGERAAVINSFKQAYKKLPESESDMTDAIKIANGRWPSVKSETAEQNAKDKFVKIYGREADMENAKDNAAVTIMAYGLRQKAENRKLESEKKGLKIFKDIFKHAPSSTEEWNALQAITYSGAKK